MTDKDNYQGIIERYRSRLPVDENTPIISLLEGNTPLIKLNNIPQTLEKDVNIYVKYEGLNPTCSFKDRGMTLAISKAAEAGSRSVICASTGNTSAAAAAYAARAGMTAFVVIPEGKIALGKLAQAMMHGSHVLQIKGNFDEGLTLVKQIAKELEITLVNSVNPFRLQGQKTAAFEIVDVLGKAPDYHCLPVGNAGNISAYWMGYTEYFDDGVIQQKPKMCGYQAEGAAPFLAGHPITNPETVATAIRIGNPQSWDKAMNAQQSSGGWFLSLKDEKILAAQKILAMQEGIFCEPASAASIAGAIKDIMDGSIEEGSTIVCTLTGHGLKDPDIAIEQCRGDIIEVDATLDALTGVIKERLQ